MMEAPHEEPLFDPRKPMKISVKVEAKAQVLEYNEHGELVVVSESPVTFETEKEESNG